MNPSRLRGHHQPVALPSHVMAKNRSVPGAARRPGQAQLEEVGWNEAVGQFQLPGYGSQPSHLGGSHQHSRRQVGALGLDVEAARAQHVVEADP